MSTLNCLFPPLNSATTKMFRGHRVTQASANVLLDLTIPRPHGFGMKRCGMCQSSRPLLLIFTLQSMMLGELPQIDAASQPREHAQNL